MKTLLKLFMTMLMFGMGNAVSLAQTIYDAQRPPKSTEKVIGVITDKCSGGRTWDVYKERQINYKKLTPYERGYYEGLDKYEYESTYDDTRNYSAEELLEKLMHKAKNEYGNIYSTFFLRDFKYEREEINIGGSGIRRNEKKITWKYSASVVIVDHQVEAKVKQAEAKVKQDETTVMASEGLKRAIDKALQDVRNGAKIAIDQIRVPIGRDKEEYKDEIVETLLDKGFKVVAKEYLEKLYEEQQNQQSGIYNEKTIVQENNFSAVGYYLNVKLTETSLRVQAINVSTGEYAGNVTIKLQQ